MIEGGRPSRCLTVGGSSRRHSEIRHAGDGVTVHSELVGDKGGREGAGCPGISQTFESPSSNSGYRFVQWQLFSWRADATRRAVLLRHFEIVPSSTANVDWNIQLRGYFGTPAGSASVMLQSV